MAGDALHDDLLSTLKIEIGEDRPTGDWLAMERARARVESAMFGRAEPARLGRYQILEPLASGGMGLVYAAYDPELDRRVALKVLHPERSDDEVAHARLTREARALARLHDHPNVVSVHDVLTNHGEIVIVMELVEGETLETWEAAAPRRWQDLVIAYAQAGEGLAAAHSVDVIHRDFKPANAIIRSDRRVRVLDFGLARLVGDQLDAGKGVAPSSPTRTAAGTIMGTPAYASPEQLAGEPVSAASDQFSFCVALHRALEGIAPFHGTTVEMLLASIRTDPVRTATDGRRVPAWLRNALRRGLAADPAHRHPSMRALLDELQRARGWKRWRSPAIAIGLALATGALGAALPRGDAAECDGGAAELATVWDPARREALAAHLTALAAPDAPAVATRVRGELDAYTGEWTELHRASCAAHRSGSESDALLDRKVRCLRQRLGAVKAAVAVLQRTDAPGIHQAVDVVVGMPAVAECALALDVDPPATPSMAIAVDVVRDRITNAAALSRAGHAAEAAIEAAEAERDAHRTSYLPVLAEAQLERGRILIGQREPVAAAPVLERALASALAAGKLQRLAVEAGARLLYAESVQGVDLGLLKHRLDFLEPMSRGLVDDRFARPLLFNNVAAVYLRVPDDDSARHYLRLARDSLAGVASPDLELTAIDRNLALVTPDPELRAQLARGVWHRHRSTLGEHHFNTLQARLELGTLELDPRRAYAEVAPACEGFRTHYPGYKDMRIDCEAIRGFLAGEVGDLASARAAYGAIVSLTRGSEEESGMVWRLLAEGELALLDRSVATARKAFGSVVARRGDDPAYWMREHALHAHLGLARAALIAGDPSDAAGHFRAAVDGYAEMASGHPSIVYRLSLQHAREAR